MTRALLLVSLALLLGGCMSGTLEKGQRSEMAEILKAAGKDASSYCFTITLMTPWGTEKSTLSKTGILTGTVSCNDSGLSVSSGSTVAVPVNVQAVPVK